MTRLDRLMACFVVLGVLVLGSWLIKQEQRFSLTLDIDDPYRLKGALVMFVEEGRTDPREYTGAYRVLRALEEGYTGDLGALLLELGMTSQLPLDQAPRVKTMTTWVYQNFDDAGQYTGGFDEIRETKRLVIQYRPVGKQVPPPTFSYCRVCIRDRLF